MAAGWEQPLPLPTELTSSVGGFELVQMIHEGWTASRKDALQRDTVLQQTDASRTWKCDSKGKFEGLNRTFLGLLMPVDGVAGQCGDACTATAGRFVGLCV